MALPAQVWSSCDRSFLGISLLLPLQCYVSSTAWQSCGSFCVQGGCLGLLSVPFSAIPYRVITAKFLKDAMERTVRCVHSAAVASCNSCHFPSLTRHSDPLPFHSPFSPPLSLSLPNAKPPLCRALVQFGLTSRLAFRDLLSLMFSVNLSPLARPLPQAAH